MRPNILWICTDQQRWDTLGCYGNEFVRTPNLDQLAENGVLFEQAFSQSPVCTPSRACFLTGRYPRTTRCRQNGQSIPADELLITKLLADAGYTCGLSGKLHLSACHTSVCDGMEPRVDDGYSEFHWSHHYNPSMRAANEYRQWLEGQGITYHAEGHPDCEFAKFGMPDELHQTTWCINKACDFMRAHAEDQEPWLFSINTFDPHSGFEPPRKRFERYLDDLDSIPLPAYQEGELANKTPYQRKDHHGSHAGRSPMSYTDYNEKQHRLIRAAYWAMCDLIDDQVGRLIQVLEETGQLNNTIVIFHSDHGEMLGDHGIYLKGPYLYDALVHVPLIISYPGTVMPQRSSALVELTDLVPTLLDAVGMDYPLGVQGRSLWPLLTGAASADYHRDDVYCEHYNAMNCHDDPKAYLTMVRNQTYKLIVDHTHSDGELYDIGQDPAEHDNLWDNPNFAAVKTDLLLQLCNRMAWTVDPYPERTADW